MTLRLTLRTLLAYLDDTLEPAQAKAIGLKVAESEAAQELVERIKQVTRRRRLTTPPTTGPANIDPNTAAEYLDNVVTPEQAAEVEQICLSSDVHLAEVAACHQILTLILGEPITPPAAASQRMYGLVKGPEAIPFRRPAVAKSGAEHYAESRDVDDTLRMGIPALGRKGGWRNPLLLVGGGFVAALLLVLAVYNVLNLSGPRQNNGPVANVGTNGIAKDKLNTETPDTPKDKEKETPSAEKKDGEEKQGTEAKIEPKDQASDGKIVPMPPAEPIKGLEAPFGPPNARVTAIGHYIPNPKESSILLQSVPEGKFAWKRVTAKQSEVSTGRQLLSLPASRSEVQTDRGVKLTLWGNVPEFFAVFPLSESVVQLWTHDAYDLDMLLERGRVVLTSTNAEKPVRVRIRVNNPLIPTKEKADVRQNYFDVELMKENSSILFDLWSVYLPGEPFFKNPDDPNRKGPLSVLIAMVLDGDVRFKTGNSTFMMNPAPGPAVYIRWNNRQGASDPFALQERNDFENPPGVNPKARADIVRARDYLSGVLSKTSVDVGLYQELNSDDASTRRLVVRTMAAISDVPNLLEALGQPKFSDLRNVALDALRNWSANGRDNDYKLLAALKERYKGREAEIIIDLLHPFSDEARRRPGLYEVLIDYLNNPNALIREVAAWQLYTLVPEGKNIAYSSSADPQARERAEAAWRALVPPGQLPQSITQPQKKKGS